MTEKIAIHVSHLSKKYTLGGPQEKYFSLRDAIVNSMKAPLKRFHHASPAEGFWALRDVSFDVEPGEVVGIIGRNGAGKSTLLKILSRITTPTEGIADIYGRVGSLLEVGTGFHPELTGRENIYLSGSILGMKWQEIDTKLDEIVKFSEIEKFLDTPVKRYSSGMYVRLAFAVAAHLEPEILLVDEVLAVGDVGFQKKCLGKMKNIVNEGRTILFVSHNMDAINKLCRKTVLLNKGLIEKRGETDSVIKYYLKGGDFTAKQYWISNNQSDKYKNEILIPLKLSLIRENGEIIPPEIFRGEDVFIELEFKLFKKFHNLTIGVSLFNKNGTLIFRCLQTDVNEEQWPKLDLGENKIRMKLPLEILNQGDYKIVIDGGLWNVCWLFQPYECDIAVYFSIKGGLSESPYWISERFGIIAPVIPWKKIG